MTPRSKGLEGPREEEGGASTVAIPGGLHQPLGQRFSLAVMVKPLQAVLRHQGSGEQEARALHRGSSTRQFCCKRRWPSSQKWGLEMSASPPPLSFLCP